MNCINKEQRDAALEELAQVKDQAEIVAKECLAVYTNLDSTQKRCTELLEENRRLKALIYRISERFCRKTGMTYLEKLKAKSREGMDHETYFLAHDIEKVLK